MAGDGFLPLDFIDGALGRLEAAVRDRHGELRNVQLATVSVDGLPQLRTLVLRGFDRSTAEMHSDARAGKIGDIGDIGAGAPVALLAWSADDHLQLRFGGEARLHRGDDLARERWEALSGNARKPYGLRAASGRPIDDPDDQSHLPSDERFEQFAVIVASLQSVDVLRLDPDGGQVRARARIGSAVLDAAWIGP